MTTIVIFGARGRTGHAVSAEAVARGIKVRAFDKKNPTIDTLRQALRGANVAVIAFGHFPPTPFFRLVLYYSVLSSRGWQAKHWNKGNVGKCEKSVFSREDFRVLSC